MSRSVSYPNEAEIVCFREFLPEAEDPFAWDEFVEDVRTRSMEAFESLTPCDRRLDREDRAVLENSLVYVGVSEYVGIASVWVVPKSFDGYDGYPNLSFRWIDRIRTRFTKMFGGYVRLGVMSNGEAVYKRME